MRCSRRWSLCLLAVLCLFAVAANAQNDLPNLSTVSQPEGKATDTATGKAAASTSKKDDAKTTDNAKSSASPSDFKVTSAPPASSVDTATASFDGSAFHLTGLPTIAGVGIPSMVIPDTARAPFMQKSSLPDGTVFICVGAALGFFGAAILAWRGLVAWSLHRSVKRAAMAQNLADLKDMSVPPGQKRGFYKAVGASSTMSLDRLSAAPTGTSRPPKPFASNNPGSTPPKHMSQSSLFFSPTAGGAAGLHNPQNRSSNYLPAGYYAAGSAQPAGGSPMTHVGGPASTLSLNTPANRYSSARSIGHSPPGSPSLPPSRGAGLPPSRGNESAYNRNSVATVGRGPYDGQVGASQSNLSLNVPGGTNVPGGRAPSAYLEDLFENHGNGPRERF